MNRNRLLLVPLLAACGVGPDAARTTAVRDSGGVRIVEFPATVLSADPGRTLAAEPELDIGGGDDPRYQFDHIAGAQQLPDGGVVAGDERALELRFYDVGGRYVRAQGRSGEGPGEYTWLLVVDTWSADTIVVFDVNQRRLTLVDAAGELVRTEAFSTAGGSAWPRHRLTNDRWLTEGSTANVRLGDPEATLRNELVLTSRTADGSVTDTVLRLHGGWLHRWWMNERQPAFTPVPLTVQPSVAVTPDGDIVVTSGVEPEVRRYSASGGLETIYRVAGGPHALDRAVFDSVAEAEIARAGAQAADVRRVFGRIDVPTHRPAFDLVRVDAAGRIWARQFDANREASRSWLVFDTTGAAAGSIATPPRLDVLEIGDDYVLGRWRDDLDVQHLRRYRMESGS